MIFLPVYLREDLEYSAGTVALFLALAQVVGIVVQPAMGWLSDRFGRKIVLVPALTAMGLLSAVLAVAEPGPQLVLTILALGAFLYSLHTIMIAAAMDVAGEDEVQSHNRLADLRRQLHRHAVPGLCRSDRRQLRHTHSLRVRRCGRPSRHPNPGLHQAPKHSQPTYAIIASINAMWGFQ